ncbi:MAG: ubiquitin-like protein UBact [Fimbriimonadaceae bacterium]|nr:ubiquitin-like protein UBact [Fimbriimonadaceae bacterium]
MFTKADDRLRRPATPEPERKLGDDGGPGKPDIRKPGGDNELLKRLRKVDPDQAKKYRQRSGQ